VNAAANNTYNISLHAGAIINYYN